MIAGNLWVIVAFFYTDRSSTLICLSLQVLYYAQLRCIKTSAHVISFECISQLVLYRRFVGISSVCRPRRLLHSPRGTVSTRKQHHCMRCIKRRCHNVSRAYCNFHFSHKLGAVKILICFLSVSVFVKLQSHGVTTTCTVCGWSCFANH